MEAGCLCVCVRCCGGLATCRDCIANSCAYLVSCGFFRLRIFLCASISMSSSFLGRIRCGRGVLLSSSCLFRCCSVLFVFVFVKRRRRRYACRLHHNIDIVRPLPLRTFGRSVRHRCASATRNVPTGSQPHRHTVEQTKQISKPTSKQTASNPASHLCMSLLCCCRCSFARVERLTHVTTSTLPARCF